MKAYAKFSRSKLVHYFVKHPTKEDFFISVCSNIKNLYKDQMAFDLEGKKECQPCDRILQSEQ